MAHPSEPQVLSSETPSRRNFLQHAALGLTAMAGMMRRAGAAEEKSPPSSKPDFPIVDYHVHLSRALTIDKAVALANTRGVKFGIVEHPAPEGRLADDNALREYLDLLKKYPVYRGVQPVYPNWTKTFSKEVLGRLDYILMDALTLPEKDGRWLHIWRADTVVTDKQAFMARYLDFIVQILTAEPLDIFGWPTYLPTCIAQDYDTLWTAERMQKVVDLALKKDIAIEINEVAQVPKPRFIALAKEAGLKFTFGTDSRDDRAGKLDYCLQMAKDCGLTAKNMFQLKPAGQKAIQRSPQKAPARV